MQASLLLVAIVALCLATTVSARRFRADQYKIQETVHTAAKASKSSACESYTVGGKCPDGCACLGLLHFNDVYSHVPHKAASFGPATEIIDDADEETSTIQLTVPAVNSLGGAQWMADTIHEQKAADEANGFTTFVTMGGDFLGPSFHSYLMSNGFHWTQFLNRMGIDMTNWGNHEFDFGLPMALNNMICSTFHWLAANMVQTSAASPVPVGSGFDLPASSPTLATSKQTSYNPEDGILVKTIKAVKTEKEFNVCFTALITSEARDSKAYVKGHTSARADGYTTPYVKWPTGKKLFRDDLGPDVTVNGEGLVSHDELYRQCEAARVEPGFFTSAPPKEKPSEMVEAAPRKPFKAALDHDKYWVDGLADGFADTLLRAAHAKSCNVLIFDNHMSFAEDKQTLAKYNLLNAAIETELGRKMAIPLVLGGHEHDPYFHSKRASTAPATDHEQMVIKVGLDAQYLAHVRVLLDEDGFSRVVFNKVEDVLPIEPKAQCATATCTSVATFVNAYEAVADGFKMQKIAKGFTAGYNTASIRTKESSAIGIFADGVRAEILADIKECQAIVSSGCKLTDDAKTFLTTGAPAPGDATLPLVILLNTGGIRGSINEDGAYPVGGRDFSQFELRSDFPFKGGLDIFKMTMFELQLTTALFATDWKAGMFPTLSGVEFELMLNSEPVAKMNARIRETNNILATRLVVNPAETATERVARLKSEKYLQEDYGRDDPVLVAMPGFMKGIVQGFFADAEKNSQLLKAIKYQPSTLTPWYAKTKARDLYVLISDFLTKLGQERTEHPDFSSTVGFTKADCVNPEGPADTADWNAAIKNMDDTARASLCTRTRIVEPQSADAVEEAEMEVLMTGVTPSGAISDDAQSNVPPPADVRNVNGQHVSAVKAIDFFLQAAMQQVRASPAFIETSNQKQQKTEAEHGAEMLAQAQQVATKAYVTFLEAFAKMGAWKGDRIQE